MRRESPNSYLVPPKRSGMKSLLKASYIGTKRGTIPGVTCWRNCHFCFGDIVRPEYAVWGNRHVNTARCMNPTNQESTLSFTKFHLSSFATTYPPRCHDPSIWAQSSGDVANNSTSSITPIAHTNCYFPESS